MHTIFNVESSDLRKIRLKCHKCGGVAEATIAKMAESMKSNDCPLCGENLTLEKWENNPFNLLNLAFSKFSGSDERFSVEFPVKLEDEK